MEQFRQIYLTIGTNIFHILDKYSPSQWQSFFFCQKSGTVDPRDQSAVANFASSKSLQQTHGFD